MVRKNLGADTRHPAPREGGFTFPEGLGVVLSLGGLVTGLAGSMNLLPGQRLAIIVLTLALVALLVIRYWQRSSGPVERTIRRRPWFLLSSLFHLDQQRAAAEYPHYSASMRRQAVLLGLSSRSLAADLGVSRLKAAMLLRLPHYVPHYEYLETLERVLLLPWGHFRRGGGYGHKLCIARLLHFHRLGVVARSMIHNIDLSDRRKVREALRVVEEQLWVERTREGKAP